MRGLVVLLVLAMSPAAFAQHGDIVAEGEPPPFFTLPDEERVS